MTADLMVFAAHGLFGTSCITNLTVQSTVGVRATHPVSREVVEATLECLVSDLPPAGIKIGMLGTAAVVGIVADFLDNLRKMGSVIPVVLDPVLVSSSGRKLLDPEGVAVLQARLLPLVDWVTPNLDELAVLTGLWVHSREELLPAAMELSRRRGVHVLATGGHLDSPDDLVLTPDGSSTWLPGTKVQSRSTHGTGCALSSALLSRLVLGDTALEAASAAKQYVREAIQHATPIGAGHGPIEHLWPLRR